MTRIDSNPTKHRRSGLARDFLEADSRWLALFRLVFGFVLLGYLILVASRGRLDAFFTDDGVLPLDLLRAEHPLHHQFTLFRFAHTHREAVLMFVATACVYGTFAVGLLTRITAPLAFVATVSLHHRVPIVVNGSMLTMHMLLLWSMFLPLGRHLSVDAWLASRRGERFAPLRVRTFAVLAFRFQLAVIYLFNVLHKGGSTWKSGSAVHYVLWQSRALLPLGRVVRRHEASWFSPLATYGTFVVESLIVILVLWPFARTVARRAAAALMLVFHLGLGAVLDLGPFPFVFACAALLLLASEDGTPIGRSVGAAGPAVDERDLAGARPRRLVREAVLVALGVHAALMMWSGNWAIRLAFGPTTPIAAVQRFGDAAFLLQGWSLFAPDAPTRDVVLMPVVTLADGRVVDTRTRRRPDFDLLDGRLLDVDFFLQTYDPVVASRGSTAAWEAFGTYLSRVPTLDGWAGERRVSEVTIHQLDIERAPFGDRAPRVPRSRVRFTKRYLPDSEPARFDL